MTILASNVDLAPALAALANAATALQSLVATLAGTNAIAPRAEDSGLAFHAVAGQFLVAKARTGVSPAYLQQLHYTIDKFMKGRARREFAAVTAQDIEDWLKEQGWAPRTWRSQVNNLRTLFLWAHKRGWIERDPTAVIELPREDVGLVSLHTPEEVRTVLDTAQRMDLSTMRLVALRYFTGIRAAELDRLDESHLHLDRGFIEVPADRAKTRRRRLVTIQPNLRAWLDLGGEIPGDQEKRVGKVAKLAGVPWPRNVMRHSFVSYHLARFENAGKTALEAGHTEQMLFSNYRELVTPEQAKAFWEIRPVIQA